jgi:hypothetical protein
MRESRILRTNVNLIERISSVDEKFLKEYKMKTFQKNIKKGLALAKGLGMSIVTFFFERRYFSLLFSVEFVSNILLFIFLD